MYTAIVWIIYRTHFSVAECESCGGTGYCYLVWFHYHKITPEVVILCDKTYTKLKNYQHRCTQDTWWLVPQFPKGTKAQEGLLLSTQEELHVLPLCVVCVLWTVCLEGERAVILSLFCFSLPFSWFHLKNSV